MVKNKTSDNKKSGKSRRLAALVAERTREPEKEALSESEAKYRYIFDNNSQPMWIYDLETLAFLEINDAAIHHYGYTKEEFLSMTLKDIRPREDIESLLETIEFKLKTYNQTGEWRHLKKNGEIINVEIVSHSIIFKDREARHVMVTDITERKLAEEELRKSLSLTEATLESIHNGILVVSHQGTIIKTNAKFAEMWNIPGDILSSGDDKILLGFVLEQLADPDEFINKVTELYKNPDAESFDLIYFKDGRIFDRISKPMYIGGETKGRVWSFLNITDRKQAEDALQESESRYRNIFENVQDLYFETTIDGTILDLSPSISILSRQQYQRDDLIGKSMSQFYADPGKRQLLISAMQERGSVMDFEITLKNRDGSFIPCSISSKISFDAQGRPEKIIGSMRDITRRKSAEEELIQARDKAEESDRLKTAFLHNISHEIRTPMNAIVGFSALLAEPDVDLQVRQKYSELLVQGSNQLLSIITNIVDISNIEANIVKVFKNEINVNSKLRTLCNQFMPKADEMGIKLICEPELPDSEALILTDSTKLTQILSDLISNALKFTDKGHIKLGYSVKENNLEFCVSDTGIGISQEHHKRIFDRFYQVHFKASRSYDGTGLGLSISKAYVEILGGKIWLDSELGKGTTFYFTIPYEKSLSAIEASSEVRQSEKLILKNKKTILIAEDTENNFKMLQYFFSGSNVEILRALNGKEAVEKCLSESQIDLVLMDLKMPVMDGYEAAKFIRESRPGIPIIAQSAYADDLITAKESGFNGFISKPFDKNQLLSVIKEFL